MILHYVHDPMCSWCWGYRPAWDRLRASLPAAIEVRNLLGGLAPETDAPMPVHLQQQIRGHWQKIRDTLGTEFNFEFWEKCSPRRSTYPACRAVLAATRQQREEEMIDAIQRAYYLRAMNPSDDEVLVRLAGELGLDAARFAADLDADATHRELDRQVRLAQRWQVPGFPSLVLETGRGFHHLAPDYRDYRPTLAAILTLGGD